MPTKGKKKEHKKKTSPCACSCPPPHTPKKTNPLENHELCAHWCQHDYITPGKKTKQKNKLSQKLHPIVSINFVPNKKIGRPPLKEVQKDKHLPVSKNQ